MLLAYLIAPSPPTPGVFRWPREPTLWSRMDRSKKNPAVLNTQTLQSDLPGFWPSSVIFLELSFTCMKLFYKVEIIIAMIPILYYCCEDQVISWQWSDKLAFREKERKKALTCSYCWFLWCKYYERDLFQATNIMFTTLRNLWECNSWLLWAVRRFFETPLGVV